MLQLSHVFLGGKKQKDLRLHVFHSADSFIRIIIIHFCAFILKKSIYADIAHRVLVVSFRLSAFFPPHIFDVALNKYSL